jgi:hypothetical protein
MLFSKLDVNESIEIGACPIRANMNSGGNSEGGSRSLSGS